MQFDELVVERKLYHQANQKALLSIAQEQAEANYYDPPRPTMTEFLAQSQVETPWRIDRLHRRGGNCTITAQYKTGKSTLMLNLLHSLADGVPFLGEFKVQQPEGKIEYWNMELSDSMFRDWCRMTQTRNTDQLVITNLRGRRQPLFSDVVRAKIIERMKRDEIECWIIDPGARILTGWPGFSDPENSNDCIGQVTDMLDEIKERAGIIDLWIPLHTGRDGSRRARGATKWDDWADTRFLLYKDPKIEEGQDIRVLATDGRDTEVFKRPLTYQEEVKRYHIEPDIETMHSNASARAVVWALMDGPLAGRVLKESIKNVASGDRGEATRLAEERGWIETYQEGRTTMRRLNTSNPEVQAMQFENPKAETR